MLFLPLSLRAVGTRSDFAGPLKHWQQREARVNVTRGVVVSCAGTRPELPLPLRLSRHSDSLGVLSTAWWWRRGAGVTAAFCLTAQNSLWPFLCFIKIFHADFDLILLGAAETATSLAINHFIGKIKLAVWSAPLPGYYFSCPDGSTQITSWLNSRASNWFRSFHFFQTSNGSTFIS